MSSTLPQLRYFDTSYRLPHCAQWSLAGHSRALERTGFILSGPATILLDAGIDVPDSMTPDMILITHAHIDHSNALPMLMRHDRPGRLTQIFAPAPVVNRLREFAQLSFSMKVDFNAEVPEHYCTPPRIESDDGEPVYAPWELKTRRWRPVRAGLTVPVVIGKGGKQIIVVKTVALFHGRCSTVGYILSERKSKLLPHLDGKDKKSTAANVMLAKSRGEAVTFNVDIPVLAFICDTSIDAIVSGPQTDLILSSPAVMIECTYLEPAMEVEAQKRGHVCWSELYPIVHPRLLNRTETPFSLILIHFSLRYSDTDIVNFFSNPLGNGIGAVLAKRTNSGGIGSSAQNPSTVPELDPIRMEALGPAHVVLWLDSGVVEFWFTEYSQSHPGGGGGGCA